MKGHHLYNSSLLMNSCVKDREVKCYYTRRWILHVCVRTDLTCMC